jgi:hypothetical protein
LHSQRDEGTADEELQEDPNCMPQDPSSGAECPPVDLAPYYIGDGHTASTVGVRGQLSVALSVPITGPLALEVAAGVDMAPFAHGPFPVAQPEPDGTDPGGDNGGDPDQPLPDDGTPMDPVSDPFTDLPAEPGHSAWWGISLRVVGM